MDRLADVRFTVSDVRHAEQVRDIYDGIAAQYDATRRLPPRVADRIMGSVLELTGATSASTFLELGIGTGRIAMPFIQRGYAYTGVDISQAMLDILRLKVEGLRKRPTLIERDASSLDFLAAGSFDIVLAACTLHYVDNLDQGMREIARVLGPEGVFVHCHNALPRHHQEFDRLWQSILGRLVPSFVPRTTYDMRHDEIMAWLNARAASIDAAPVIRYTITQSVAELIDAYSTRAYPTCWRVSEATLECAVPELREICREHYGSLDIWLQSEMRFELIAARDLMSSRAPSEEHQVEPSTRRRISQGAPMTPELVGRHASAQGHAIYRRDHPG